MYCFYHNDADGRCAGAIVRLAINPKDKIKFVEIDYKDTFPIERISGMEAVYIVDFSLKPEVMNELLKITHNIVWIDHHKTADEYVYDKELNGLRITKEKAFSGCELTWKYFFNDKEMPWAVKYIGDRDKWAWNYETETAQFCEGLKLHEHRPEDIVWKYLLEIKNNYFHTVISEGNTCLQYKNMICADYTKSYGWETIFEEYKCFANGIYMFGSEAFGNKRMEEYNICISYEWLGDNWIVGLYSLRIDVGEIAKKYGGGGHKGASGFVCKILPFKKIVI